MKRAILSDPFQRKPEMAFFSVIFLFQLTYLGELYEWDQIWKFQIGYITCKWTSKRPEENMIQMISYKFSLCIFSRKKDSVNGMPENVASRRILTKMKASIFHKIWSNIKNAGINHQYMDIYHTKKQTENIPRSCSYLLLKTKHCFISYRSVLQNPILKVACVN